MNEKSVSHALWKSFMKLMHICLVHFSLNRKKLYFSFIMVNFYTNSISVARLLNASNKGM